MKKYFFLIFASFYILSTPINAATFDNSQLSVWANEAIVATYSYDYKNFMERQKEIAKYFTADAWIAYSAALNTAKLPQTIKENSYFVSAVATLPPSISTLSNNQWQAMMPVLVLYQNPQYKQTQTLNVTLTFKEAQTGGVRGLAITSVDAKESAPACKCQPVEDIKPSETQ